MAKQPEQRFVSLNQMAAEIEDLMMPATAPGSGTPAVGVPAGSLSYTISGPISLAVPTHVTKEASGLHRETVIFGHGPSKRPAEDGAPAFEVPDDWSRKLAAVAGASAPAPAAPVASIVGESSARPVKEFPSTVVPHRVAQAVMRGLHDRRILAGAAAALVIAIGTLIAASGHGRSRPSARVPPMQSPPAAVRPTITVTQAVPGGGAEVPSQPDLSTAVAPLPLGDAISDRAPATAQPKPHSDSPGSRPIPAQVGKRGIPRAGTLRVDDF